jgi:hypothetical protein
LLNTLAATAATTFAASHVGNSAVTALSAVHSYTVAFAWSAGIFAAGGLLVAMLLRSGIPQFSDSETVIAA